MITSVWKSHPQDVAALDNIWQQTQIRRRVWHCSTRNRTSFCEPSKLSSKHEILTIYVKVIPKPGDDLAERDCGLGKTSSLKHTLFLGAPTNIVIWKGPVPLFVRPSDRLFVSPSVPSSVRLSVNSFDRQAVSSPVFQSVRPSFRQSVCPSICLSVCPSVSQDGFP